MPSPVPAAHPSFRSRSVHKPALPLITSARRPRGSGEDCPQRRIGRFPQDRSAEALQL